MYNRRFKSILLAGLGGATVMAGSSAHAAGTVAGTSITNTASVSYNVGTATMTAPSASATFLVDKKVNLTVAQVGSTATQTTAGSTAQVTTFTVTNLTNATEDFRLTGDQPLIVPTNYGIENFTVSNIHAYVDSNNNGIYDAGDTQIFINSLAPDASATVFVVADIPNTAGASVSYVSLLAVAADVGTGGALGADIVATPLTTADSPTTVDIVFADGGGLNDLARNGQARAYDAYQITTAAVSLTKTATVVSDPVNGVINPKAIPGATVSYCMIVSNTGPATATNVVVTDVLPTTVTYTAGSLLVGGAGVGGICGVGGSATGGSFDGTTVRGTMPTLLPNVPLGVVFTATIN